MKKTIFVLAATALLAPVVAAADLPAALVEPYLQVQVALSADQIEGLAKHGAS